MKVETLYSGNCSGLHPFASIVIPYAPYHAGLVNSAVQSALNQSVPVEVVTVEDSQGGGAGAARNAGASVASASFISFLDADDQLHPAFIERCLLRWQPGRYLYTDWLQGIRLFTLPDEFPQPGQVALHLNTTLMTRHIFQQSGGYPDGELEDTAYYWSLMAKGVCGLRVPEGLVYYSGNGQRSAQAESRPDYHINLKRLYERYSAMAGGCGGGCGGTPVKVSQAAIVGSPQEGDVLVIANWGANMKRNGRSTGRIYPSAGHGRQMWVAPEDQAAQPDLFVLVEPTIQDATPEDFEEIRERVLKLAQRRK